MTISIPRVATNRDRFNGLVRVVIRDEERPAAYSNHHLTDAEAEKLGRDLLAQTRPAATGVPVMDSAEFAWDEFGSLKLDEFGQLHADDLNDAGRVLMQQALIDAWARRGRLVRLVGGKAFATAPEDPADPTDAEYQAVWQEAADSIDYDALLTAADLTTEYNAYRTKE